MKEVQIKEEFNEYYAPNPSMNDYRVEKIANPLADPYIQIEQPIYTDFANAPMLNQQDMLNPMNFSTNYMGATQFSHQQTVQLNLLDLSGFSTFNSCDPALPLMHQSPSQQNYVMPHSTFTPPPQDPLVAEQKPLVKKRMAAVQCHQNSICSNCKTRETTLWRRNGEGGVECNACNLYFRKNNRKRPLSLRKDGIMKRNRRPRNESPNGIRRQATC
nr:ELT-3A protein [Caenorhabditis angaria]